MNQDHFRIGPLIYAKDYFEDDPEANYYYSGSPPVSYNNKGVPIDKNGFECLDIKCPFHPGWMIQKDQLEFNDFLQFSIPRYQCYQEWLRDNYLDCSDNQAKKYLFKFLLSENRNAWGFNRLIGLPIKKALSKLGSVEELIEKVYEYE
jgi:hypothetical protein